MFGPSPVRAAIADWGGIQRRVLGPLYWRIIWWPSVPAGEQFGPLAFAPFPAARKFANRRVEGRFPALGLRTDQSASRKAPGRVYRLRCMLAWFADLTVSQSCRLPGSDLRNVKAAPTYA